MLPSDTARRNRLLGTVGRALSRFIEKPLKGYQSFSTTTPERLRRTLRPCDVLLVEGNSRVASAIKYLTNSTWSHVAFYAGGDDPDAQMIDPGRRGADHRLHARQHRQDL